MLEKTPDDRLDTDRKLLELIKKDYDKIAVGVTSGVP
jgi:hypothetical protein